METRKCYKCGKEKVAIRSSGETTEIKMVMITYGKHKGEYKCQNCKDKFDAQKEKNCECTTFEECYVNKCTCREFKEKE
jgi:DNA-directed RNA polymerase subunit RPC12/RpoP